ncbi:hypothetical protein AAFC00_004990 [Neodothiora populina]
MKVDSPSAGMENDKALVFDDEQAIASDSEQDPDFDIEAPPYKRICRGTESALSMALRETNMMTSFTKPVLIRVGPSSSSQDFHIHEARLVQSSPFFADAFEKLRQGTEQSELLELEDDSPIVFQLYAQYIYNPSSIADLDLTANTKSSLYETYVDLLQAYIFGEKVQNTDFQNEVMNRILRCMGDMHRTRTISSSEQIVRPLIELLYPSLPPDSIGRGLAVETFIVLWSHSDKLQFFVPDLSRELLTEIAEMLLSGDKDHIRDAWAQAINGDYSYYHSARSDEH